MALTKFLARDLTIAIRTAVGPDVWTPIGGLDTLTHSPSSENADTTGFDDNGRAAHIKAQRGESWDLAGKAVMDVATGAKDPGQEAVEALASQVGLAAEGRFQITDPANNKREFSATAEVTLPGGGTNDAASWGASLEVTGAPIYTPAP